MNTNNLWLKLSLNTRCVAVDQESGRTVSSPTSSGPIWIGLLANGELRATVRWDVPAGHQPALPYLRAQLLRMIADCNRWAPANSRSSGTLNIGLTSEDYGYSLDAGGQRLLDSIEPKNMDWIVDDQMRTFSRSGAIRPLDDSLAIIRALVLAGVSAVIAPEKNNINSSPELTRSTKK